MLLERCLGLARRLGLVARQRLQVGLQRLDGVRGDVLSGSQGLDVVQDEVGARLAGAVQRNTDLGADCACDMDVLVTATGAPDARPAIVNTEPPSAATAWRAASMSRTSAAAGGTP